MAKCRHRVFEIYEFQDEAVEALTRRSKMPETEAAAPDESSCKFLSVSRGANITHVVFKEPFEFGAETLSELKRDFARIGESLTIDSRVLLDFANVKSFAVECVEMLVVFNKTLRHRGSRIVLCSLSAGASEGFFPQVDVAHRA